MNERIIVLLVAVTTGMYLIAIGRHNINTGVAEESGKRRIVNGVLNRSNVYTGNMARVTGYVRIISGIIAIGFGIVFLFTGPFLKQ